jgi:cytochrome c oxidase subunit 2
MMEQPMQNFFGMPWLPIDVSEHGAALDSLNWWVHLLAIILFVGWTLYFIYVLFRFRQSRNPKADYAGPHSHLNTYVEIGVIVAEIVLLVGFSIPLWAQWTDDFPEESESVVIRVVAEQFAWNFHYSGTDGVFGNTSPELIDVQTNPLGLDMKDPNAADDVIAKRLFLPVDKPIITHLLSKDVIHSFGIPTMRVKQDIIPGSSIPVTFKVLQTGKYLIACSQLCGTGHSTMRGFIEVLSQNDYENWLNREVEKSKMQAESGDDLW